MKKVGFIGVLGLVFVGMAGSAGAYTLADNCSYFYGNSGFNTEPAAVLNFLGGIEALADTLEEYFPNGWAGADLETVTSKLSGDGIPDSYQLAMLAAALCAGNADLLAQYNANKALVGDLIADITALKNAVGPLADDMSTVGGDLLTWVNGKLASDPTNADLLAIKAAATKLVEVGDEVGTFLNDYGSTITSALGLIDEWLAAQAGLNSEMKATLTDLVDDLLSGVTGYEEDLTNAAAALDAAAALLDLDGQGALADACEALAADIIADLPLLTSIGLPDFIIYGSDGKTVDEILSAMGDFDGDGVNNKVVYDGITAGGGDVADFVAASTGSNPFWPGNPALPAASLLGLGVMASIVAAAGAAKLRKH